MSEQSTTDLLPRRLVSERYLVNPRTIVRWEKDSGLGFPQPIIINGRAYFSEAELTMFDRTRRPASSAA